MPENLQTLWLDKQTRVMGRAGKGVRAARSAAASARHVAGADAVRQLESLEPRLLLTGVYGDANLDGNVSLLDLDVLGANWQSTNATWGEGDFSGDGTVSLLDLDLLGRNWGFTAHSVSDDARIEAEDFDPDGLGRSYSDTTPGNNGEAYRTAEWVDIEETEDVGGGYNLGWVAQGEWTNYNTVIEAGVYDISARVASNQSNPSDLRLSIWDGSTFNELGTWDVPNTGGWQDWATITLPNVTLPGGRQTLRLEAVGSPYQSFNINWIEFNVGSVTQAVQSGNWSDPATWSNGVPDGSSRAIIPPGQWVRLDGLESAAKQIVVHGILDVEETSDVTRHLTTDWIHVNSGGVFQIGTAIDRYDEGDFVLTLTGTNPNADYTIETATGTMEITDNDGFLMAAGGGRLQFFGEDKLSFTKLAQTASAGTNLIVVENLIERNFDGVTSAASDGVLNWEVGDEIVIASSTRDYSGEEVRTITGVSDLGDGTSLLALDSALSNRHYGEIETYSNDSRTYDIDMRAEVALISRNVRIQGLAEQDTDNFFGDRARYNAGLSEGIGGHIMIMDTAGQISVEGVQLDLMGQTGQLGRYPIHWHLAGDRTGDVLRGVSITNSNNRGVTIHGTHNTLIQDVVLHDIQGHGFFMEDAVETGNIYLSNITFGIHKVGRSAAVGDWLPDLNDPFIVDTHDHVGQNPNRFLSSAGFWMTNPDNTWVGNISAGSEGTGFWFIFPEHAIGVSASDPQYANTNARRTNMRLYDHNSAHSSPIGFNYDRGPDITVPVGGQILIHWDGQTWLPPQEPQLDNTTVYQTRIAIYHRGLIANFHENRFADNFTNTFITFTQRITDTLYVGHSRGNATPSNIVTGHTLYDGANTLDGVHFAGFAASNAHTFRGHSAALRHTHHVMTNTSFENDGSAGHVSIANQSGGATHSSGANQFTPSAVYDGDGTLTGAVGGGAGHTIVSNHPFFYDAADFKPSGWNAWVSDDTYSLLHFNMNNGNTVRFTAPDGDSTSGSGSNSKTVVKMDAGDYTVDFPSRAGNGINILYYVRVGPDDGATMVRFAGIANSLRPNGVSQVGSVTTLRNANSTSYAISGNDLWVKFHSSSNRIYFVPTSNSAPAIQAITGWGTDLDSASGPALAPLTNDPIPTSATGISGAVAGSRAGLANVAAVANPWTFKVASSNTYRPLTALADFDDSDDPTIFDRR